jgi:hypothetical protein
MQPGQFTIRVFVIRKPGLSSDDFKDHWENKHISLLQSLSGPRFPLSHTRHYLARDSLNPDNAPYVLVGMPGDFTWDAYAEITFESETQFKEFVPVMSSQEVIEDEKRFTVPEKMRAVVVGDVRSTKRNW